ncbi:Unknown protein [Striga hermonthica]|uniref:Uncharacterized protein n=1 Tax=Striga hermonthica TaxID=68872 RepID=A0A9N7MRV2_STRHE|nr:Unknown protein [Striga hermonthica]
MAKEQSSSGITVTKAPVEVVIRNDVMKSEVVVTGRTMQLEFRIREPIDHMNLKSFISALIRRPDSGAADDPLCAWLYDTFHSGDPDLRLAVLRHLPSLAAAYLSRAALHKPLAGFESVLLAIYAHETAARSGHALTATIPDLSHPSLYHETSPTANRASTELHLAIVSPSLEPHGTVRSTRRARIVGVALELYYANISEIPVESKIEFCRLCRAWAGPEDADNDVSDDVSRNNGRINLPWELMQPILRILGHCVMGPEKSDELFRSGLAACRSVHGRAMRDINPKAVLASMSLVKLAEASVEVVDYTEIGMSNVISF